MATPLSSTVLKAFEVIQLFTQHQVLSVPQCADLLDTPRSTTYRLLATLREAGVVETTSSGNFRLGFRLFEMGSAAPLRVDLIDRAQPPLEQLTADTGLGCQLAVHSNQQLVYLERIRGRDASVPQPVGLSRTLNASALGKVLLASADAAVLDRLLDDGLPRYTEATITTRDALTAELRRVTAQGWAEDREECAAGRWCIAVPVRDRGGDTIAAISISGPQFVVQRHHARLRRLLRATARRIERGPSAPVEVAAQA